LLKAIEQELLLRKNEFGNEKIETIYFGGGTPSLLNVEELQSIFKVIYTNFNVVENAEITLEANPDDLSETKIIALAKLPINRLSIGVQSFFDDDLLFMNRAHTAKESKTCLTTALQYFDNITIDLIYGIPNMSTDKWLANLRMAFEFGVPHISSYALTVEEKTALASFIKKKKVPPVDENLALKHFNILVSETNKHGFIQYEISNFGKPNYFSKHNTSYWLGKKYLGIGPSAHSFNGKERSWNISNNIKYIKAISTNNLPITVEKLSKNDCFNENIMTGLRTIWGVSLKKIYDEFGEKQLQKLLKEIKPFIKKGLLEIKVDSDFNEILVTTEKGKFLADGIASDLFTVNY
jgi:oxygen-independent coproporphyrinogen-3 oxidase